MYQQTETSSIYELATPPIRCLHFIIDAAIFYFITTVLLSIIFLIAQTLMFFLYFTFALGVKIILFIYYLSQAIVPFLIFYFYYIYAERCCGKTFGKYITRTKVITKSGEPLTLKICIIRNFLRFIPLDVISIFFSENITWHDSISNTYVVKDIKNNE
jgi:uncharacterized RDD family membrane protein YckC